MEKKKTKIITFLLSTIATFLFAWYFFDASNHQATYEGLPTTPCINPTQKVVQDFSFTIIIYVNNKKFFLDPTIGHDYGNCLHTLFTNDTSGTVYVRSNTTEPLTLGQFFDTWHKTFSDKQIFEFGVGEKDSLKVFVNGKQVERYREIILKPNQQINIVYTS